MIRIMSCRKHMDILINKHVQATCTQNKLRVKVFLTYRNQEEVRLKNHLHLEISNHFLICGWLGGAMVLGKLPVPGRPTNWD